MGALPTCTSPGVSVPYSAPQSEAPVYPRRQPHHRAPSVLSVSLRSRRLPSPRTLQGLFHPRCAPGVPADLHHSTRPFDLARAVTPTFPLQGFHLYRDGPVLACPPLLHLNWSFTTRGRAELPQLRSPASTTRSKPHRTLRSRRARTRELLPATPPRSVGGPVPAGRLRLRFAGRPAGFPSQAVRLRSGFQVAPVPCLSVELCRLSVPVSRSAAGRSS
jgi:hypothetical protein